MKIYPIPGCVLLFSLLSGTVIAQDTGKKTTWELGVGATTFSLPLYPGSSQRDTFIIPFPFFHIQSEYVDIDEGIRGFFFESPDLRLTVSGDIGVPVDSQDSAARQGMPDLDAVLQLGPSLEFVFSGGRRQPSEFRFELPLRAAIATDFSSYQGLGWIIEPRLTYETLRPFDSGFNYQVSAGLQFASEDYNAYYYDVAAEFATPERAAFTSRAGYNSFFIELSANIRRGDLIYFAFSRYRNLKGAVFEDSPLVEQNDSLSLGVGIIWIFASSL